MREGEGTCEPGEEEREGVREERETMELLLFTPSPILARERGRLGGEG